MLHPRQEGVAGFNGAISNQRWKVVALLSVVIVTWVRFNGAISNQRWKVFPGWEIVETGNRFNGAISNQRWKGRDSGPI